MFLNLEHLFSALYILTGQLIHQAAWGRPPHQGSFSGCEGCTDSGDILHEPPTSAP